MSILIDPYMFELSNEQEISDNIPFFINVIKAALNKERRKSISIAVYRGMLERMQKRTIQPFPIQPSVIKDTELRKTILQLNNSFNNALIPYIENLDIDDCDGNQEFVVSNDTEMIKDNHYYELLSTLLVPCYSNNIVLDSKILTGNKTKGKHIGDTFELVCNCEVHEYKKRCLFVSADELISDKDKVIQELKLMKKNGEFSYSKKVTAFMGDHHNHVQKDGKKFSSINDLSSQNKTVLGLLRELGLFKIIFGKFTPKGKNVIGTMTIQDVCSADSQDIVTVNFTAETEMVIETILYFPRGIGELLKRYFKTETLTYQEVAKLIENIK